MRVGRHEHEVVNQSVKGRDPYGVRNLADDADAGGARRYKLQHF